MANKLEIELTSKRPDGFFTWRAKGAKNPKGIVAGDVFPGGKVGDSFKVEVEYLLDGPQIISVLTERQRNSVANDLKLFLGRSLTATNTKTEVPKKTEGKAPVKGRATDRGKPEDKKFRDSKYSHTRGQKKPATESGKTFTDKRPEIKRPDKLRRPANPEVISKRPQYRYGKHVKELLDSLDSARQAIVQRLVRGGMAAVREAIEKQNKIAREKGEPELLEEPVIKLAEELVPQVKRAQFRDQAQEILEKGLKDLKRIIRTINTATVLDDSDKELLTTLREYFDKVLKEAEADYFKDIESLLSEGKVEQALEKSIKPPYPTIKFSAELSEKLAVKATEALEAKLEDPDSWLKLLHTISLTPVKRLVRPERIPQFKTPDQHKIAIGLSSQIPNLIKHLGLKIPPPPGPKLQMPSK